MMSESAKPAATPPASAPNRRGNWRDRLPLKFLGALRGEGKLSWPGGEGAVTYQVDLFAAGEQRRASGNLEGEFPESMEEGGLRLTLSDGREIDIAITAQDDGELSFEVDSASADLSLVSR